MVKTRYLLGLELARLADLPEDIITEARRVAEHLAQVNAQNEEESESSKIAKRRKALLRVIKSSMSTAFHISRELEAPNSVDTGLRIFGFT